MTLVSFALTSFLLDEGNSMADVITRSQLSQTLPNELRIDCSARTVNDAFYTDYIFFFLILIKFMF